MTRTPVGQRLPDFPWDSLAEVKATAYSHPDGPVDLSIGSPVDPVAPGIQLALAEAAAEPGYPATVGTRALREAAAAALRRRYSVTGIDESCILPVIGTKEAIAWLPTLLGLGAADTVVIPPLAYPTYEVGARLAGARIRRSDDVVPADGGPNAEGEDTALFYLNSPANPTGRVQPLGEIRAVVAEARRRNVIVASDECYLGLGWSEQNPPISVLDPRVSGGDLGGLLAIHSLSKTSNLAGYRAGFLAGDPDLIAELSLVRKHAGLMVPGPVQAAMIAALEDDDQERLQKARYADRRSVLIKAVLAAGFTVEHSDAGLYLWATRRENGGATTRWFAERGILVAPGGFYGPDGADYVRISLTASDERIAAAARRLCEEG